MPYPICRQGILQRLGNVLLADDLIKGLGTPFAVKDLGRHR
jgi:hypothetical protein